MTKSYKNSYLMIAICFLLLLCLNIAVAQIPDNILERNPIFSDRIPEGLNITEMRVGDRFVLSDTDNNIIVKIPETAQLRNPIIDKNYISAESYEGEAPIKVRIKAPYENENISYAVYRHPDYNVSRREVKQEGDMVFNRVPVDEDGYISFYAHSFSSWIADLPNHFVIPKGDWDVIFNRPEMFIDVTSSEWLSDWREHSVIRLTDEVGGTTTTDYGFPDGSEYYVINDYFELFMSESSAYIDFFYYWKSEFTDWQGQWILSDGSTTLTDTFYFSNREDVPNPISYLPINVYFDEGKTSWEKDLDDYFEHTGHSGQTITTFNTLQISFTPEGYSSETLTLDVFGDSEIYNHPDGYYSIKIETFEPFEPVDGNSIKWNFTLLDESQAIDLKIDYTISQDNRIYGDYEYVGRDFTSYASTGSINFINDVEAPVITTRTADNIGETSATIRGRVDSLGDYDDVDVRFRYWKDGTTDYYYTSWVNVDDAVEYVNEDIIGLDEDTDYNFRFVGAYNGETLTGGDESFKTLEAELETPIVSTLTPININDTSATLRGELISLGDYSDVAIGFELYDDGWMTLVESVIEDVNAPMYFNHSETTLEPDTEYSYRAFVSYNGDYKFGITRDFKTTEEGEAPADSPSVIQEIEDIILEFNDSVIIDLSSYMENVEDWEIWVDEIEQFLPITLVENGLPVLSIELIDDYLELVSHNIEKSYDFEVKGLNPVGSDSLFFNVEIKEDIEVENGILYNIFQSIIGLFPDSEDLTTAEKIGLMVLVMVLVSVVLLLISSASQMLYIVIALNVLLFIFFIGIGYVPISIIILLVLILIGILYIKFFINGG